MTKSSLSVIMPNYNYANYIGEALNAILTQSFRPTEIIIVDDGSTDNSVAIIKEYMKNYSNIRLIQNEKNMGINYSNTLGLKKATGEYIYGCASDDRILPGFFEKSMELSDVLIFKKIKT